MFTVTKRYWNFLSADDRGFTFRGSYPKSAVQHVTDSDKLGIMCWGRRCNCNSKSSTNAPCWLADDISWWQAWEKRLIWNFNFKMCADFEPSNEGKTNLWIVERLCVKNNTVFPLWISFVLCMNSPYNSLGHSLQRVHCIILLKENLDESKCLFLK